MIAINFLFFKDNDEERDNSDNIEIMINDQADEVIEELFESLISRYQIGLETSMKDGNFMFNCVQERW